MDPEELTQEELMDAVRVSMEQTVMEFEQRPPGGSVSNLDLLQVIKVAVKLQDAVMLLMVHAQDQQDTIEAMFEDLVTELAGVLGEALHPRRKGRR